MNTNTVAARITIVRGKQSRRAFANSLGIKENTLRNYEQGLSLPNFDTVSKICKLFSVSPEWLILGEGEMNAINKEHITIDTDAIKSSQKTDEEQLLRFAKLENKLEKLELQRDEIADENRQLHRDKEALLRENGELREKVARLEERKRRYELTHGFPVESSKVGS